MKLTGSIENRQEIVLQVMKDILALDLGGSVKRTGALYHLPISTPAPCRIY